MKSLFRLEYVRDGFLRHLTFSGDMIDATTFAARHPRLGIPETATVHPVTSKGKNLVKQPPKPDNRKSRREITCYCPARSHPHRWMSKGCCAPEPVAKSKTGRSTDRP